MHRLILLSDLHMGVDNNAHHFRWLVVWIIANCTPGRDIVVIPGDLVDTPSHRWFKATARLIRKLRDAGFDVLCVPGNHDIHRKGVDLGPASAVGRAMWKKHIDPVCSWDKSKKGHPKTFQAGDVKIIGVDTNEGNSGDWAVDFARGVIGKKQQTQIALEVQDQPCVLLGHHRLFWDDVLHCLVDADELYDIISGQAWGWICGHRHKQERIEKPDFVSIASRRSTQPEEGCLLLTIIDLVEGLPSTIVDTGQITH